MNDVIFGSYFSKKDIESIIPIDLKARACLRGEIDPHIIELLRDKIAETTKINFNVQTLYYRDQSIDLTFIGRIWDTIGPDETGDHFKNSVRSVLKTIFGKNIECRTLVIKEEDEEDDLYVY